MLDPITSGGVLTNDGGNGGGSNYPSSMRRAPLDGPRKAGQKSADEPTGYGTNRTSDHQTPCLRRQPHRSYRRGRLAKLPGSPSSSSVGSRTTSSLRKE